MSNLRQITQIRKRKLGILILDSRRAARRTIEECAEALGVPPEKFQAYETGQESPSLPQLELLSLYLNVPLDHFWGKQALSTTTSGPMLEERDRMVMLRNRVIGASLRLARTNAKLSLTEFAENTGLPEDTLKQYELGAAGIPTPDLEAICLALNIPLSTCFDQHGPIGKWRNQQETIQKFLDLEPDAQHFVTQPVNRPYLELARRLSELNVEKLRAVAEGLLEITF
ncbi:MAG: helix-turn-helix domain-containing protein [Anaerolineaceae bacterium]|nr:helix-turn-helix domain-containing protein [Anaerolineaceae bacterium]